MITSSTRHLTASIVVVDPKAEAVLLVRHKASGFFQFLGGHIDPDEAPHEAALREVLEETGIQATIACRVKSAGGLAAHPPPWLVFEIPAPAKPDRGPGKPAEPAHSHIDFLYVGIGNVDSAVSPALSEVGSAMWFGISLLGSVPHVRPDVLDLAADALVIARDFKVLARFDDLPV